MHQSGSPPFRLSVAAALCLAAICGPADAATYNNPVLIAAAEG